MRCMRGCSAYAGAGGGASGQSPPGVFIVGDPKQSIYRFRGAEPRVFAAATRFVREGLEGSVLACDHTRRNAPEVIAAINGVFGQATAEGAFEGFRAHTTEVEAAPGSTVAALPRQPRDRRAGRPDPKVVPTWRDSLTTPRLEPDVVLREQEAAAVARAIAAELAAGTAPANLFVLCRKRETLRLVAAALEREQIAHSAVEDTTLASTTRGAGLIAVLDAVVSPAHRLSLARALRSRCSAPATTTCSPLGGGARRRRSRLVARPRRDGGPERGAGAGTHAVARLAGGGRGAAAARPARSHRPRGRVRERTVAVVPPEQRALALDAIDAVLAQALLLDGGRYATPYGFVRALKRRAVKSAPPVRADAVRLLTIHGAKGLEADTVFITDADPSGRRTETDDLLVDWPVEAERRCAAPSSIPNRAARHR
jgi:ATP-dependent helicase/nuclease subunit A